VWLVGFCCDEDPTLGMNGVVKASCCGVAAAAGPGRVGCGKIHNVWMKVGAVVGDK
jgi:hypothetical protein